MPRNPNDESRKLRFGPYAPPQISVGDEIQCEIRGLVTVADWRDCPGGIMWPRCKTGRRRAIVICGDLIRAMKQECGSAVAAHWGVAEETVYVWRKRLGITELPAGTSAVMSTLASAQMTGQPAHPSVKAGLLRAARRPKSEDWKRQAAEWLAKADKPELKWILRKRYIQAGTPHQCPICGRFIPRIEAHECLRGSRIVSGELHVPGIATPFRLCQYCLDFKAPEQFFGAAATCRKCRSIRQMLRDRYHAT